MNRTRDLMVLVVKHPDHMANKTVGDMYYMLDINRREDFIYWIQKCYGTKSQKVQCDKGLSFRSSASVVSG